MNNIIEIRNLKKKYDEGKVVALDGVNLEIKEGEFVSIIGPSGSGKSTLLNMIGALDRPDEGFIRVAGYDLMETKDLSKFRSKEIGFVFQLHNLIPNLTVLENVQIPMFEMKLSSKEMQKKALKILKSVNLTDKINQIPTKLSGGERQRVAIARALANNPSIILADEPTGALDSKTGKMILKRLKDVHKKENVTLVMVTHEPYVAKSADRIVRMLDGKIIDDLGDNVKLRESIIKEIEKIPEEYLMEIADFIRFVEKKKLKRVETAIEVRNLSKRYKDVQAVEDLNMKVRKGEIFGFLGPNGAGKTTTIKMMMGLTLPSAGEIFINGEKVSSDSVHIRRDIGYIPEQIAFYENLTPLQTLHFFCELKGADKSVAESLLKEVGLGDVSHRKVGTFSKGMIQLLGIAQAMIGNPSIYILDEPMGGLDARWVKVIRDKIKMLNEEGATIVISSHILSEVQILCDRVAIIDRGRIIAEDTIDNLSHYLHIEPRLEIYIPGLDGEVPEGILDIEGVRKAEAEGDLLFVNCEADARVKVIRMIEEEGKIIRDFKTIEPSLEEAFLKLISKERD